MKIDLIRELREKTQASFATCKKALEETKYDVDKALVYLSKLGVTFIESGGANIKKNGVICSYVHPGDRIGTLVEVTTDTDFTAKTTEFKHFAKELAMQITAMKPKHVSREDVPFDIVSHEMSLKIDRLKSEGCEDVEQMLASEMEQWYSENCLLEQPYIRDGSKTIKEIFGELIMKTKENCKIERFERWEIGQDECEIIEDTKPSKSFSKFFWPAAIIIFVLFSFVALAFCSCDCVKNHQQDDAAEMK